MRWESQRADADAQQTLPGLPGLVRTVRSPEFRGVTYHEVRARSVLNRVPGQSLVPFRWTVNPYRGCSHSCVYCFARNTHTYLDFDAGRDFDTQVVVKINAPEVLAAQLRRPGWTREHVAMGTNTDPYQRAEGRYELMPGIIRALAEAGTPFSILTKGTVASRDLPLLRAVSAEVDVGLGVSIALLDRGLQRRVEPGTPSPAARLDLVRKARESGLRCGVMIAPVLPCLTDSSEALDELLAAVADAGATSATVLPLHLRPGAREWYGEWLAREHPELVPRYRELYAAGSYADGRYRRLLAARVAPLLRRHGFDRAGSAEAPSSRLSAPRTTEESGQPVTRGEQLKLL
ncbi:Rv2578c family radical SAM protein [Amycolatopsis taiwanensis]|uniref:Radical SAM protein n=1 Tax=Amycolatopsis taiwanensis TaxID=342230 RepID=A0A9W6R108_9PSEU|nr:Rv2578c family radical SAM protein [Amycolatopsis taiwanensis]GLY65672.1 radical SAM protein [Amycolatopsis taiwanensis]